MYIPSVGYFGPGRLSEELNDYESANSSSRVRNATAKSMNPEIDSLWV